MTPEPRFLRLNETVKNPAFDKRTKHSYQGVQHFEAGMPITAIEFNDWRGCSLHVLIDGQSVSIRDPQIAQILIEKSSPTAPESAQEALFEQGLNQFCAIDILGILLKENAVSMEKIRQAAIQINAAPTDN